MLVLTREVGELICIGEDIWIKVLEVRGGSVRLGIRAPSHIEVHRSEVMERIQAKRELLNQKALTGCRA